MAEEIKRKRKIRGGHRGVVTKLTKEADEIIHQYGNQLNVEVVAKLEAIENSLSTKKKMLQQLDEEILEKCKDQEIDNEIQNSCEIDSMINEALSKITACKKGKYGVTTPTAYEERMDSTSARNILPETYGSPSLTNRSGMQFGIKLPKIALPKYNGDFTKFQFRTLSDPIFTTYGAPRWAPYVVKIGSERVLNWNLYIFIITHKTIYMANLYDTCVTLNLHSSTQYNES